MAERGMGYGQERVKSLLRASQNITQALNGLDRGI